MNDAAFELKIVRKRLEHFLRAQSLERTKFRADFILGAIRQNPFPQSMLDIFTKATQAEDYIFGIPPELDGD